MATPRINEAQRDDIKPNSSKQRFAFLYEFCKCDLGMTAKQNRLNGLSILRSFA
jgi:hypothetical protein